MTASTKFTFFTSHNDTKEQQQSKQQFLSIEDQYIKLLNLIGTAELGTKNEVALRDWLSTIKVLGQIHSAFYQKLDTKSQDIGVVDTMINWGNTLEKPYLDYIKAYDQAQAQHQALLCASIKSIIKNMSPTSPYSSTEGLLAAPLDQLELYKSIYLTLLDTSDSSKQLPLNNIIQNIDTILQQAPPRMVDPTSTTDLLSFQNFVDCENVIDLFTGSSLDYQLRPRPGKIVLQDDFLLLGDSNDQPATRVHMVLSSDILMICKQMVDSTGRYDLLYPPLAVNDILVKPSMMDRELIGEYTLELTVLSKTLVLRAESREVRNAWTGMPLTATPKDAITTNVPLKNVACSAPLDGNGINNNSIISLNLAQNGKSDLGTFYGNHDISPVESSEDDDDSDEDNDSHATTASTSNSENQQINKKSLPSLPAQPQPPKKDEVIPPPKDAATPVINISLHDDKNNTAQPSSNRPITPRGSSIRAPLPNPAFRPNTSSSTHAPELKPLPRTSSIRHRQQNAPRPENNRPPSSMMTMQRPPHQQQAPPQHQMHHPQQRPPHHQQQHRSMTGTRPPPPSQQQADNRPMMMTPPQPQFSARPPNGPHQQMQHRPPPPHHHHQQQPHPGQMRPPQHPSQQPRPPQHQQRPPQQQQQQQYASKPVPQHPGGAPPPTVPKGSEPAITTQRPMPPTPPPQQSQFSSPSSSSSESSSSQSHLPLTPGSRDSFGSSLRLSPEDLATPPRSPNPYSAQQNNQNGIRQVLFRSQQCEVFRWNDESWYAVEGQCILEVRQTFTNRSCIAIRVQTTGELYLNAWVLPQTQIRLASPTDVSLGVIMGSQQETYLVHFGEPAEAAELNQVLQKMHHAAVVAARQPNDAQRTLRGEPPTEMMMAAMQLDDDDEDDNQINMSTTMDTTTTTMGRTTTRSSSLMQSGKEPTLIPQTLEPAMQCKCKLFVQNEHSNWSSFGSVQVIVSLQVPSRRMHIQIEHEKKRGLSKIIPTVNNNNSSNSSNNSPSPPSPSSSSSSSLPGTENGTASPTTANTLVSATVYSNNVTRLGSKRISFLLVNERERTSSMVYMVQLKDEDSGNALYNYLKIKNAEHGW